MRIYIVLAALALTGCEVGTDFYQRFTQEHNSTNIFYCDDTGYMVEESVTIRSNASTIRLVTDSSSSYVECIGVEI